MIKTKWKKRVWLNPLDDDDNGYFIYGQESDGDGILKFADCSKIISFNLWFSDKKGKNAKLKKLKLIRDGIDALIEKLSKREV